VENNDKSKLDEVLEGYKPIPMKRMFYPRGMKLSEDFVNAFHREYDRLVDEGINPKTLVERFGKAMKFHVNEPRKYKLLDEEKARLEEAKKNKKPDDDGDGVPNWADKKPGDDDHHKSSEKGTKKHKKKHK
jgi:hypothetical protein